MSNVTFVAEWMNTVNTVIEFKTIVLGVPLEAVFINVPSDSCYNWTCCHGLSL